MQQLPELSTDQAHFSVVSYPKFTNFKIELRTYLPKNAWTSNIVRESSAEHGLNPCQNRIWNLPNIEIESLKLNWNLNLLNPEKNTELQLYPSGVYLNLSNVWVIS